MRLPNVKRPCKDCPFKKDTLRGWLGAERMTEILDADTISRNMMPSGLLNESNTTTQSFIPTWNPLIGRLN